MCKISDQSNLSYDLGPPHIKWLYLFVTILVLILKKIYENIEHDILTAANEIL